LHDHEEKREERMWRLAAGRGHGRVGNFLLLKLTKPKSGEDRNQGGTKQK
jgi:hypothetical protein